MENREPRVGKTQSIEQRSDRLEGETGPAVVR
jgi:hypothetical protein